MDKPKRNRIQRAATRQLRDKKAIEMAIEGKTQQEIANELNVDRTTVNRILSSDDVKRILKQADSRLHQLVTKAMDVVEAALDGQVGDMTNALKGAQALLKSAGVFKDRVDISHTFPKPTIITRRNGDEVILGVKTDDNYET